MLPTLYLRPLQIFIDALSVEVLSIFNMELNFVDGEGRVFDPDPVSALSNSTLADNGDSDFSAIQGAYDDETLRDLNDKSGGVFRIQGRYAQSVQLEFNQPGVHTRSPVTSSDEKFLYKRN